MVQNVYIAKAVEDKFKDEPNKSGLINDLLLQHYGVAPSSGQKHYPERREVTLPPVAKKPVKVPAIPGLMTADQIPATCTGHLGMRWDCGKLNCTKGN